MSHRKRMTEIFMTVFELNDLLERMFFIRPLLTSAKEKNTPNYFVEVLDKQWKAGHLHRRVRIYFSLKPLIKTYYKDSYPRIINSFELRDTLRQQAAKMKKAIAEEAHHAKLENQSDIDDCIQYVFLHEDIASLESVNRHYKMINRFRRSFVLTLSWWILWTFWSQAWKLQIKTSFQREMRM